MKVIGVTGGVGCGKSTVLAYIEAHYDAKIIKADEVGHELMKGDQECRQKILDFFGEDVLGPEGEPDRKALAAVVFADPQRLEKLNSIMHPAIKKKILKLIEQERACGRTYCVVEAALLLEDHYEAFCDELWYIYADEAVRMKRLGESRGYTEEKTRSVMANQLSEEEFTRRCDVRIDNSGDMERTQEQIRRRLGDEVM